MKPKRTEKQRELMGLILRAAGDGKFLSVKELHEATSYGASYGAIRISLRFLEKQEMIEKQRSGQSTLLVPTERAYDWYRPKVV